MVNRSLVPATDQGDARLYYLDWLRIIALLTVFFLHCAKIFDYHTTDLFNTVRSPTLSALRDVSLIGVMPLFFAISGGATAMSQEPDRTWRFIKTRFLRLVIPLVGIGTFVINPIFVYAIRLFQGQAQGNFFQWYPQYFKGVWFFGGNFAPLGIGTHLWYLMVLFLFSMILLPFFLRTKRRIAAGLTTLSERFETPGALALLFIPLSISGAAFELAGLGGARVMGGWDLLSYLLVFIYGFMIFSNRRIQATIRRWGPVFLLGTIALTALHIDAHFGFNLVIPGITRHDMAAGGALRPLNELGWAAVQVFRGVLAWGWVIGLLGTGARLLDFGGTLLSRANEAVMPVYILHHSIILVAGAYVVRWNLGVGVKFFLIAVPALLAALAIYILLIRRFDWVRFLFGMKPNR